MNTAWTPEELMSYEENLKILFEEGRINCPLHLSGGNEVQLIELFKRIKENDYVLSTHRAHYHYLLKGGDPQALLDEIRGETTGICEGNGRSMHLYDVKLRFYTSAIVGGVAPIAAGIALNIKKMKLDEHVWCFVGDGAEDQGSFVEAVRFGVARDLPLTFVIEDNDLSIGSTKEQRWHNYQPIKSRNIIRYNYERKYPHCGIGKWVGF